MQERIEKIKERIEEIKERLIKVEVSSDEVIVFSL
jgi:hypothetical protein